VILLLETVLILQSPVMMGIFVLMIPVTLPLVVSLPQKSVPLISVQRVFALVETVSPLQSFVMIISNVLSILVTLLPDVNMSLITPIVTPLILA